MLRKTDPPHCRLAIKWRGEPMHILPVVSRQVVLEGAKRDDEDFSIQLPQKSNYHLCWSNKLLSNDFLIVDSQPSLHQ